jgi:transposase InsO family protein
VKFHFIDAEKARFPVSLMCRVLKVSRSGYYRWAASRHRPDRRLGSDDAELRLEIRKIHRSSRGCYGRPRIHAVLRRRGWKVSAKRVARLLATEGLRGRGRRPRSHTENAQVEEPSSNLLERNFAVDTPNRVWVGDIKQVQVGAKSWYVAAIVDLHGRVVVGFHVSERMDASLVTRALRRALDARRPEPGRLIFHSDQGVQYRSRRFRLVLGVNGITQSMSRRGNCWDNAPMESFFATLELECLRARELRSGDELRAVIAHYLRFYHRRRVHSSLGYLTPEEFGASTTARATM